MNGVHLSFYLKTSRIHIFVEALRLIGCPGRICFLISADGRSLLMRAHETRDLKSHKIPRNVYAGRRSVEISSRKLCGLLADLHGWDLERSYRVSGVLMGDRRSVRFSLAEAEAISKNSS